MKKVQKCTGIHDHSSTMCLNWVGWGGVEWDVLTIVILTLHLLWRELSLEINSLKLLTYLILTFRNDLCGTGASKLTAESEPCTHIR